MTRELTRERRKTVLDETSFQQLLAAAYVLQQHSDRMVGNEPQADPTRILSEIVEIQKLTDSRDVDIAGTSQIIAERLQKITSATGVAICIIEGDRVLYLAGVGTCVALARTRIAIAKTLSADSLGNGKLAFGLRDSQNIARSFPRGKSNDESFISVPFQQNGMVAGALELKFGPSNAIPENDISAAQLMAGLMSDAMERADGSHGVATPAARVSPSVAVQFKISERDNSFDASHFLNGGQRPQLPEFFREDSQAFNQPDEAVGFSEPSEMSAKPAMDPICHSCGHHFRDDEYFCGTCGLTRFVSETANSGLQSKWASLWYLHKSSEGGAVTARRGSEDSSGNIDNSQKISFSNSGQEAFESPNLSPQPSDALGLSEEYVEPDWSSSPRSASNSAPSAAAAAAIQGEAETQPNQFLGTPAAAGSFAAASSVPSTLQSGGDGTGRFWRAHRAEAYVGLAVLLLIVSLSGWGKASLEPGQSGPQTAAGRRKNPPKPKLTAFETLLVGIGLAEPPPAPIYEGNPETQVWEDLHTALYYCPGTDLFGATPKGQMTTQRSAQLDQFQPADRKPCD